MKKILHRNTSPFTWTEESCQGLYKGVMRGSCHQEFDSADHEKYSGRSHAGQMKALAGDQNRTRTIEDSALLIEYITDKRKKKKYADRYPTGL